MPLYSYRAINDDNKEVQGTIEAPDEFGARQALEEMHVEVKEVSEAMRMRKSEAAPVANNSVVTFAFEGTDTTGTLRRGAIQAADKRSAFDKLKQDQRLMLTMLSPSGVTPQYRDTDLENWQRKEAAASVPEPQPKKMPVISEEKKQPVAAPNIQFTMQDQAPVSAPIKQTVVKKDDMAAPAAYYPLITTFRLYAGWLLGWYGLFVSLGYYSHVRSLPWNIPFVEAFYLSPLIFSFTVAIFLFLLLSSVHRALHGKLITGVLLSLAGIAAFVFVRMNLSQL